MLCEDCLILPNRHVADCMQMAAECPQMALWRRPVRDACRMLSLNSNKSVNSCKVSGLIIFPVGN
jgi:hypothetical protein